MIILGSYVPVKTDGTYTLEYWYDRHQRYWVIQIFDSNDVEVESETMIRKPYLKESISEFKNRYNVVNVIRK